MKKLVLWDFYYWCYIALWIPAMFAASYTWTHGEYYSYGWFVPVAAGGLAWKRWARLDEKPLFVDAKYLIILIFIIIPTLTVLRIMCYADPAWRLPVGLLGFLAAISGHYILLLTRGWRVSLSFGCITLLWMSSLPWPAWIEFRIVKHLTEWVVTVAAEIFQICGKPVEIVGDRLRLHDLTVEVTDGCSGIRSFQSFVMASCFFAEFQSLKISKGLMLFVFACLVAFLINLARTYALAEIRFIYGLSAFEKAHDVLGLAAFFVSGTLFYLFSGKLAQTRQARVIRTLIVKS
jgi:exosortase